jgi:hypothetical protein
MFKHDVQIRQHRLGYLCPLATSQGTQCISGRTELLRDGMVCVHIFKVPVVLPRDKWKQNGLDTPFPITAFYVMSVSLIRV